MKNKNRKIILTLIMTLTFCGFLIARPVDAISKEGSEILNQSIDVTENRYYYNTNHEDVPNQITLMRYQSGKVYVGTIPRTSMAWNSMLKRYEAVYKGYLYYDPTIEPASIDK